MLEPGLIGLVLSDPTVAGLIGSRLYAIELPENAVLPAATYQIISGSTDRTFANALQRMKRVQMDFWASTGTNTSAYGQAKGVEEAVAKVLDGFSGTLAGGARILHSLRSQTIDYRDLTSRFYRVMNEYEITYVE